MSRLRSTGGAFAALSVGGLAVIGAIVLFRQGLLPLLEAAFQLSSGALSVVRRIGIVVFALGAYWGYVRGYERRPATELAFRPAALALGAGSGALLVGLPIAVLFAVGAYELVSVRGPDASLLGVAALIGIAATLEELFYRCLLLRVLEQAWGLWPALAVQALIFAAMHLGNVAEGDAVDAATVLVSVTALGLLWAGVFVLTRNLWVAAANHAAWNFTILCSGVPLSGNEDWRSLAPLESRYAGEDWLTGGLFGPENSVLVIVVVILAVLVVFRRAQRRSAPPVA